MRNLTGVIAGELTEKKGETRGGEGLEKTLLIRFVRFCSVFWVIFFDC